MYRIFLLLVLGLFVIAGAAVAQDAPSRAEAGNVHYAWANVTRVNPIYRRVEVSDTAQRCYQEPVARHEGGSHIAGTVLGAVIGGVLGNTVGKGDGRRAATVAGAVAGGAVGNGVARRGDRTVSDSVTRCEPVRDVSTERRIVGYDVQYRYRGQQYMARMDYDPGERLRVRVSVAPAD
jgi:uncharacterized protein YcfJ